MKLLFHRRFGSLVAALALAVLARAQTYNAFDQFSAISNPAGTWSYGYQAALGGTFTAFTSPQSFGTGMDGWGLPGLFPFVMANTSGSTFVSGSTLYPADTLSMHPDNSGNFAVLRFTAPLTGTFALGSAFADVPNDAPATVDVHVFLNNVGLTNGTLDGGKLSATYNNPALFLTAGDTLDFIVGYGTGGYINDHTVVAAALTVVPEPAASALLLATVAGLLGWRRRRR